MVTLKAYPFSVSRYLLTASFIFLSNFKMFLFFI